MKLSKTAKTAIAFGIGACVFVSTAFADMILGSGYEKLKSSVKYTAGQLADGGGMDSFTLDATLSLEMNGEVIEYSHESTKYDLVNQMQETNRISDSYYSDESQYYSYNDRSISAWKYRNQDQLYVHKRSTDPYAFFSFDDPFQEEGAVEVEKIVDAVVGNLQDLVQVDNNSEGSYQFSGSLNAAQVPAVVNAVSSFVIKQMVDDQRYREDNVNVDKLPQFTSEIYVTSINGFANENEQGLLTELSGEIALSGKDEDGQEHQIELKVELQLKDINSTTIETPDISNAIIETYTNSNVLSEKYEGKYVSNIVVEKDSTITKIGERILVIEDINEDQIIGTYEEIIFDGYEELYAYEPISVVFTNTEVLSYNTVVHYVDDEGNQGSALIYEHGLDSIFMNTSVTYSGSENEGYVFNHNRDSSPLFKVFE